jgi:hypothetical protein
MKLTIKYLSVLALFYFTSCNNSGSVTESETTNKDEIFYPITSFIRQQVSIVDSLPLAVFKYTTVNGHTDSVIVSKEDFKKAAERFLYPDISDPSLKESYEETTFLDATINTVTITYNAKDKDAEIRKADVLINPENDKVKNIYIEKHTERNDSSVTHKLLWKANRNFQVISIISIPGKPEMVRQEKYVWDFDN